MIVDSCIDRSSGLPVALQYLGELGLRAEQAIALVVVTHWHDDHMAGAARVLQAATGARFFCSQALSRKEFLKLVAAGEQVVLKSATARSGTSEFSSILATLLARRQAHQRATGVGPQWAMESTVLHRRSASAGNPDCEIVGLAPSSASLTRSMRGVASLLPAQGDPKRAAVNVDPNETSLVLAVRVGAAIAILGADLETGADPSTGWNAVVTSPMAQGLKAQVYKVPHHGSENAHHAAVWSALLESEPHAVLTPFAAGRKFLPSADDLARMKGLTPNLYVASRAPASPAKPLDKAVERTIREVASSFRQRAGRMGHIRLRIPASTGVPTVELFGAAHAA
jgi:hypothetical protein